jgi:putative hemolysin
MKWAIFLFVLFTLNSTWAENYKLTHGTESVSIPFTEVERVLVNDVCEKAQKKCLALKVLRSAPQKLKDPLGQPADSYCKLKKGIPLQLKTDSGEEKSFCAFSDQSIISSWDLFHRHFPVQRKRQGKK